MNRRFILRNRVNLEAAMRYVAILVPSEKKPLEITIQPFKKSKSLEQLAYLFGVVYKRIAEHLAECGMTDELYSADVIHEYLAGKLMPTRVAEINGEVITYRWSAKTATVSELSKHIEKCIQWAASIECVIPPSAYWEDGFGRAA